MRSLNIHVRNSFRKAVFVPIVCLLFSSHASLHAQTGKYLEVLNFGPDKTGGIFYSLAYSPDSQWLAVGTYNPHAIEIRSAATGQILKKLIDRSEHENAPISIPVWNPNGIYIAEVSIKYGRTPNNNSGIVHVWDVKTGGRKTIPNRHEPESDYADDLGDIGSHHIAWHPNGTALLIMDNDRQLRLIAYPSNKVIWLITPYKRGSVPNPNGQYPCRPQWNTDGSRFVCIGDGIQAIFDGLTGKHLLDLEDEVSGDAHPQWTRNGRYILNVDVGDGYLSPITVWDATNGQEVELPFIGGFPYSASPDVTRIAYIERNTHQVIIAAFNTGEILARLTVDYNPNDPEPTWSPNGRYLAIIDRTSKARIFASNYLDFVQT
jgi:WD40 repeat protein